MPLKSIRCYTCNKCLGVLYDQYDRETARINSLPDVSPEDRARNDAERQLLFLDLHAERECCRMVLMTSVDMTDMM